jgi:hypothetical protein
LTNFHKTCIFQAAIINQPGKTCIFQAAINNHQSTILRVAAQIFLCFEEKKAWDQKETFVKYWQSEAPRPPR